MFLQYIFMLQVWITRNFSFNIAEKKMLIFLLQFHITGTDEGPIGNVIIALQLISLCSVSLFHEKAHVQKHDNDLVCRKYNEPNASVSVA